MEALDVFSFESRIPLGLGQDKELEHEMVIEYCWNRVSSAWHSLGSSRAECRSCRIHGGTLAICGARGNGYNRRLGSCSVR